ncbi:uncharacterized protein LOC135471229 [Liolophura sinensis]|uniref:uncharacterized protein LOC135471229 n=1 Tax=Liolophura sinensis TaxID=3198878 RepID=UPI0031581054
MPRITGVIVVVILYGLVVINGVPLKPCDDAVEWVPDLDDCSVYYLCAEGTAHKMTCTDGFSFQPDHRVCVPQGSDYDTCKPSPCSGKTGKIPHPDSCAMFYDCDTATRIDHTWEPRLRECTSPNLYNTETNRCEGYQRVDCGDRKEPKSACGYYANQCRVAHCIPCVYRYASCEGLRNGLHAWPGREGSPHYIGCRQERVLYQRECPRDEGVQIFDNKLKQCVLANSNFV